MALHRKGILAPAYGLALLLSVFAPTPAHADDEAERARNETLSGKILPLAQILTTLQKRYPGEVLDVKLEDKKGRPKYEIRVLQRDGRILEIEIDARSGRFTDVEEDD